jgi:hypothetical protein
MPRNRLTGMNVLIAADMEGIAGIEDYRDCLPSHPSAYVRGRRQMTDEVLVAIEALRAGGAERISVGDWHMVGTNVERERMPEGVAVRPIADLAELLTAVATIFRTSQVSKEYRQLAKLLPPADSRLRAFQRRAGSLLATPVMRRKERDWLAAVG